MTIYQRIRQRLDGLSVWKLQIFSVGCTARLLPTYEQLGNSADLRTYRAALSRLWALSGQVYLPETIVDLRSTIEATSDWRVEDCGDLRFWALRVLGILHATVLAMDPDRTLVGADAISSEAIDFFGAMDFLIRYGNEVQDVTDSMHRRTPESPGEALEWSAQQAFLRVLEEENQFTPELAESLQKYSLAMGALAVPLVQKFIAIHPTLGDHRKTE
jgi:hypothetical protein